MELFAFSLFSLKNLGRQLYSWAIFLTEFNSYEPRHEISNNVVCATNKGSDQPETGSLIRAFASRLNII